MYRYFFFRENNLMISYHVMIILEPIAPQSQPLSDFGKLDSQQTCGHLLDNLESNRGKDCEQNFLFLQSFRENDDYDQLESGGSCTLVTQTWIEHLSTLFCHGMMLMIPH